MKLKHATVAGLALCMAIAAVPAAADNTTSATAHHIVFGEEVTDFFSSAANNLFFYDFNAVAGRSYHAYCWVTGNDAGGDCELDFRDGDGTSVSSGTTGTFDAQESEPVPIQTSTFSDGQAFLIPGTSAKYLIELDDDTTATSGTGHLVLVETTLFSPWYFVNAGLGYDGFIEIANPTFTAAVGVVVTAFNADGTTRGTTTITIPANGGTLVTVTSLGAGDGNGWVQIAHRQMPGGIVANITTLSATTGLSFDSPFTSRSGAKGF